MHTESVTSVAFVDSMTLTSVDLLEQLRLALDDVEPLLAGRIVDIELARLRVLVEPVVFRREFAALVAAAVADAEPTRPVGVRVARIGKSARIEVLDEQSDAPLDRVIGSMTLPLAAGASGASDN